MEQTKKSMTWRILQLNRVAKITCMCSPGLALHLLIRPLLAGGLFLGCYIFGHTRGWNRADREKVANTNLPLDTPSKEKTLTLAWCIFPVPALILAAESVNARSPPLTACGPTERYITGVLRIVHCLQANYSGSSIDMRRLHFNCHVIA